MPNSLFLLILVFFDNSMCVLNRCRRVNTSNSTVAAVRVKANLQEELLVFVCLQILNLAITARYFKSFRTAAFVRYECCF